MYRILCKTEGSRPCYTNFSMTNKCFDSTQIYNKQQHMKINSNRASMIETLFFFFFSLKISVTAISFYLRNDTPTFCHLTEFIPKSVQSVLCLVHPDLFFIHYCLFIFSKNSFLSLAPLTNSTPTFSML